MWKQRLCVALVLVSTLTLTAPGVAAAQPTSADPGSEWVAVWQQAVGTWVAAWQWSLGSAWGSVGLSIDPWGQPTAVSTPSEGGYAVSPAEAWDKEGLSIDPDGAPAPAADSDTDSGHLLDPHG